MFIPRVHEVELKISIDTQSLGSTQRPGRTIGLPGPFSLRIDGCLRRDNSCLMKSLFFLIALLSFELKAAKTLDPKEVPWLEELKTRKLFFFHVCGSSDILPTHKSLNKDFVLGTESFGYFFTETPNTPEYWSTLQTQNKEEAINSLRSRFGKAHLWRYSKEGLLDLGTPTKFDFPFKSTIKDCLEGSENSLGIDCQKNEHRKACCQEKFNGPLIYWGTNHEFVLKYSPDPSVKLKVPGESKNRFCNFQQILEVKGSGR